MGCSSAAAVDATISIVLALLLFLLMGVVVGCWDGQRVKGKIAGNGKGTQNPCFLIYFLS
jgi:uncharacterized protein (TIGR03382 family)